MIDDQKQAQLDFGNDTIDIISSTTSSGSGIDSIVFNTTSTDSMIGNINLGNSGSYTIPNIETITIPTDYYTSSTNNLDYYTTSIQSLPNSVWGYNHYQYSSNVSLNEKGIEIRAGGDIKVDGKSLTESIAKIEERLSILNPNPELEDRWEELKNLRKQYIELEKNLLEKEKIMKILKET